MIGLNNCQKGAVPLILLIAGIGLIGFLALFSFGPFKDKLLSTLSPKPNSNAATSTGIVALSLSPSQVSTNPNSTFNLDIMMDTKGASASAAQVQVKYDPQFLEATQINPGAMLTTILTPGAISSGLATITLGATPGGAVNGAGRLASISFKALSAVSSTQVLLDDLNTQVAVIGMAGDQAGILTPSTVTINSLVSPSPSTTPTPLPSPSATPISKAMIEAESMSLLNPGGVQVFSDPLASGGAGLVFFSNTSSSTSFSNTSSVSQLVVRAKGDQCKGAPSLEVKVDNVKISRKPLAISAISWTDYALGFNIAPGSHSLSLAFTNDYASTKGSRCDRNLRVDRVTLY